RSALGRILPPYRPELRVLLAVPRADRPARRGACGPGRATVLHYRLRDKGRETRDERDSLVSCLSSLSDAAPFSPPASAAHPRHGLSAHRSGTTPPAGAPPGAPGARPRR